MTETDDTCCPKASGLPCRYVPISDEPVDQLFSHNAVGMCPQPVAMVLKLHPTVVMADFLPQIFQLDWVLDKEMCKLLTSLTLALVSRVLAWALRSASRSRALHRQNLHHSAHLCEGTKVQTETANIHETSSLYPYSYIKLRTRKT